MSTRATHIGLATGWSVLLAPGVLARWLEDVDDPAADVLGVDVSNDAVANWRPVADRTTRAARCRRGPKR